MASNSPPTPNEWIRQIFHANSAKNGGVVRRSRQSVDECASISDLLAEVRSRGFHLIETGEETASTVASWAESQNNIAAAQRHFVGRLIAEGRRLHRRPHAERFDHIIDWLETAEGNALYVHRRLGVDPLGRRPRLDDWIRLLGELTAE